MKGQEVVRFVSCAGQRYRVLHASLAGAWLISYEEPGAPQFVAEADLERFDRVETPEKFIYYTSAAKLSKAQCERLAIIQPLLEESQCICDKVIRRDIAAKSANTHHTSIRRVLRLYYRYLATGILVAGKPSRKPKKNETYDWAIRTFYYSSKRLSLKASYEMMLIEKFTEPDGTITDNAPSWSGFQHYFYKHGYHKKPQKIIAREGLSYYQRNHRMLHGAASNWRQKIGCFQMDATMADIYLVSRLDRSSVIGRPNIYLAVDTATQLIAGIYVGMEAGESAVMNCLSNAATDKVDFCARYGVEISSEQWPSKNLPSEIITDQGREFCGERMNEFCARFGTELHVLPPFRPDRKGIVEKTFDLLQSHYKPLLRGKGVIESDAQERWATDYRSQAMLNLDEFTAIVLHCVIYLNSGRCLSDGKSPAQRWLQSEEKLLEADPEKIYRIGLPRMSAKMTRKGIRFNNMYYIPSSEFTPPVGSSCTIAFDRANIGQIFVIEDKQYYPCRVNKSLHGVVSQTEWDTEKCRQREAERAAKKQQLTAEAKLTCEMRNIIAEVYKRKEGAGNE